MRLTLGTGWLCGILLGCAGIAGASGGPPIAAPQTILEAGGGATPESTGALRTRRFGARDVWYGIGGAALTMVAAMNDRELTRKTIASDSQGEHRLASAVLPLGNPAVVGPVILVAYGAGRLWHRSGWTRAAWNIGASFGATTACVFLLKEATGRARPSESPDDAGDFRPFSGQESFPSGHAAIAFATATALDLETSSRWIPLVAYPAAVLVGWSRVHDHEHWTSDIVAGAVFGVWTAHQVENIAQDRQVRRSQVGFFLWPSPRGTWSGLQIDF